MKTIKLTIVAVVMTASVAQATIQFANWSSGTLNTLIPDGNPAGIYSQTTFSGGLSGAIADVNVTLDFNGGYNGDLYGYLVLQSADNSTTTSVLLNRVGRTGGNDFGFSTSGMHVVLTSDTTHGYQNIHDVLNPGAGPYLADGRTINPLGDFTGSSSSSGLDALNGHDANGTWTLFLADVSGGSISTLQDWSLEIDVVPEPVVWALGIFGLLVAGVEVKRRSSLFKKTC